MVVSTTRAYEPASLGQDRAHSSAHDAPPQASRRGVPGLLPRRSRAGATSAVLRPAARARGRAGAAASSPAAARGPGRPAGPPGRGRAGPAARSCSAPGTGSRIASPSMPTGMCGRSDSMTTSRAVSAVSARAGRAGAAAPPPGPPPSTWTPTTPSRPVSSRARRPEARDVVGLVRVVADQHGLRPVEDHLAVGPDRQVRARPAPVSRSGSMVQRGAGLVVAVGGALDDLGVGAERCVVHEGPAADHAEVDPDLDAVAPRASSPAAGSSRSSPRSRAK